MVGPQDGGEQPYPEPADPPSAPPETPPIDTPQEEPPSTPFNDGGRTVDAVLSADPASPDLGDQPVA